MALIKKNKDNSAEKIKSIEESLYKSKSFYSPGAKPTQKDLELEKELIKVKNESAINKDKDLRQRWYGDTQDEIGERRSTFLEKFLTTLQAPMSAIAGAVEYGLGKGSDKTFLGNVIENVKEQGTYGDILRSYNLPNIASAPLGFILDIGLDPINWATLGTGAFIPRVAKGAIAGAKTGQGVLSGAALGAKSGLLSKGEKILRAIPGASKRAFGETPSAKSLYRDIALKSQVENGLYEFMTGETVDNMLENAAKKGIISQKLSSLGDTSIGRVYNEHFKYDPSAHFMKAKASEEAFATKFEEMRKMGKELAKELSTPAEYRESLQKTISSGVSAIDGAKAKSGSEVAGNLTAMARGEAGNRKAIQSLVKELEEGGALTGKAMDRYMSLPRALAEGEKGLSKEAVAKTFDVYRTGFSGYDKLIASALTTEKGKKILDGYSTAIQLFKSSKLIPWGTAGMNATAGNFVMYKMMGLDATPEFWNSINTSLKLMRGDLNAAKALSRDEGWARILNYYPELFQSIHGINASMVTGGEKFFRSVFDEAAKMGKTFEKAELDEILMDYKKMTDKIGSSDILNIKKVRERLAGQAAAAVKGATKEASKISKMSEEGVETTLLVDEILRGPYGDFVNSIKKRADAGQPFAKAVHWVLTKPTDTYSKIDQTYRLGTALHLSKNGISRKELSLLAKRIPMSAKDIVKVDGRDAYKLSPIKSMEVVNTMYMNYLAMPNFVRFMRSVPIVGAPFASFMYGMTAGLFPQTLAKNPAFINKVQYAINELSGLRTPLEKEGLESKYYNYFDQPGMVKLNSLGIFGDNPVYLNLENMLGYYTLLPFQELQRDYGDRFGGKVAKVIDATPFFKTPDGQFLLDYFIFPQLIGEANGMFGQPLWPQDASMLEKAGVTLRGAVEPFVPGQAGLLGLAIPSEASKFFPGYTIRKFSGAKEGKSAIGIQTKTPAAEKTIQSLAGLAGLPIYKMDLTKINTSKKKKK